MSAIIKQPSRTDSVIAPQASDLDRLLAGERWAACFAPREHGYTSAEELCDRTEVDRGPRAERPRGAFDQGGSPMKLYRNFAAALSALAMASALAPSNALAWAPASTASIHPGVMTFTGGSSFLGGAGQCTSNFV